ncbi:MAG: S-layer homology domain-containing protein [Ruminococcaceae bacterium]|nr:S-layer homology domain-containing protein [Oscillospiraceae bacterium]
MRNAKRIAALALAMVVALTSLFATVSFAASFSDVDTTYHFYKAIDDLVNRGILNGYEDGTFKPDGNITRAEFSKIIAVASAPEGMAFTAGETGFPDVPADNWAAPYVSFAVNTKLVKGYEDGTFGPNNNVTYAEAITMIMRALGYEQAAVQETLEGEPWYAGFIAVANKSGVTNGAMSQPDVPATRGLICQLVYNMNNTSPMEQVGVDMMGNPIFEVKTDKTYSDAVKKTTEYTGQVLAIYNNTVDGGSYGLTRTQIRVGDEVFEIGNFTRESLAKYLGYEVKVTYRSDSSTSDLILSTISMTSRNKTYEVKDDQFESVSSTKIEYYEDEDAKKASELRISSAVTNMIFNGRYTAFDSDLIADLASGSVLFLDNNNDDVMDVAFITSYQTFYLSEVIEDNGLYTLYDKYQQYDPIVLGGSSNDVITIKTTSNGSNFNDAELRNITKDSIVSIAQSKDEKITDVIVSTWTTSAAVNEKDTDMKEIMIGNDYYAANEYYKTILETNSDQAFAVYDTAKFYLDFLGRITAIKLQTSTSTSYGYVAGYVQEEGSLKSDTRRIMLVPNSGVGGASEYVIQASVRINGAGGADAADAISELEDAATLINTSKASKITVKAEHAGIVKYDASGTIIKALHTVDNDKGIKAAYLTDGSAKLTYSTGGNAFKSSGQTKFSINGSTKVFVVPNDRTEVTDYKVSTGTSYFENEATYYIDAYDVENGIAKAVVVYDAKAVAVRGNDLPIVVMGKSKVTSGGENVWKVSYYTLGDDLTTDSEGKPVYSTMETDTLETLDGVEVGDIIRIAKASSVIEGYEMLFNGTKLYTVPTEEGEQSALSAGVTTQVYNNKDDYFKVMYGTVTNKPTDADEGGVITIVPALVSEGTLDESASEAFTVDSSTMIYAYDAAESGANIFTESGLSAIYSFSLDPTKASRVLIVSMNDTVEAIVIVK